MKQSVVFVDARAELTQRVRIWWKSTADPATQRFLCQFFGRWQRWFPSDLPGTRMQMLSRRPERRVVLPTSSLRLPGRRHQSGHAHLELILRTRPTIMTCLTFHRCSLVKVFRRSSEFMPDSNRDGSLLA
jgi:hypothetical protein